MGQKTKVKELEAQIKELTGNWKRALADYQNLEKRWLKEKEERIKLASEKIVIKLLPILDILEKASFHLKDKGLDLALKQFFGILKQEGLERIESKHKKFDPNLMECVEVVLGEEEDKVVEELRPGYKLKDKVVRPAQVKVLKRKIEAKEEKLAKEELRKGNYM